MTWASRRIVMESHSPFDKKDPLGNKYRLTRRLRRKVWWLETKYNIRQYYANYPVMSSRVWTLNLDTVQMWNVGIQRMCYSPSQTVIIWLILMMSKWLLWSTSSWIVYCWALVAHTSQYRAGVINLTTITRPKLSVAATVEILFFN